MNHNENFDERGDSLLSQEELNIDQLISKLESSENPTYELSLILENIESHLAKTFNKTSAGKKGISGKYTLNDPLNKLPVIKDKIFKSSLTDEKKLVLLHLFGDKEPGSSMVNYYKSKEQPIQLSSSNNLTEQAKSNNSNLSI